MQKERMKHNRLIDVEHEFVAAVNIRDVYKHMNRLFRLNSTRGVGTPRKRLQVGIFLDITLPTNRLKP